MVYVWHRVGSIGLIGLAVILIGLELAAQSATVGPGSWVVPSRCAGGRPECTGADVSWAHAIAGPGRVVFLDVSEEPAAGGTVLWGIRTGPDPLDAWQGPHFGPFRTQAAALQWARSVESKLRLYELEEPVRILQTGRKITSPLQTLTGTVVSISVGSSGMGYLELRTAQGTVDFGPLGEFELSDASEGTRVRIEYKETTKSVGGRTIRRERTVIRIQRVSGTGTTPGGRP